MSNVTPGSNAQDSYAIAGGADGKRRLDLLADIMRPTTLQLLAAVGVGEGDSCLDVGCGGGHVTLDIATIAGPTGSVVGVDFDPEILELAREDARAIGADNVQFHVADARAVDGGLFDLVYARFFLSHVDQPEAVFGHLTTLLTSGGVAVVEDIDFSGCFCHPAHDAFDRYLELYVEAVRLGGGDAHLGRRRPAIVGQAGLTDVGWNVFQPVHADGPHKAITTVTMERIGPAVLRHGLATMDEIDEIVDDMRTFANDPTTLVAMPRMVQAWGRSTA